MAEQKKASLPKRCGEAVKSARISTEVAAVPPLNARSMLISGKDGVEAMALHPWGLAVVYRGEVHVVPGAAVTIATLAAEE